jgi:hypothetical protein
MTKITQRWTGRLSILVAAAVLLTGSIAGLNKWKLAANATSASAKTPQQGSLAEAKVKSAVSKLPLAFEQNLGQTDARVKYVARASGYTVFLTDKDAVLSMQSAPGTTATVRMEFEGSKGASKVTPDEKMAATATYMVGDRSTWRKNVPMFAKVRYQSIYPGIEVAYQGDSRQFRYDFVVKPGADANAIRMNYVGAEKVSVTKEGDLALEIGGKTLVNKKPYIYQEVGGEKKQIAGNYTVTGSKVGFELGAYDHASTLVIDPTVIVSSYIGGAEIDTVNAVAVNTSNNAAALGAYVTGTTNSISFTGATGVTTGAPIGLNDVFVLKTNLAVTTASYMIYLGGTNNDAGNAIAVDQSGRASIVGTTFSTNFGALTNAQGGGTEDGFFVRLNALGNAVEAGLYLGGANNDFGTGVALDNNGVAPYNTFIGGYTDSPTFIGNTSAGSSDAFIVKIAPEGTTVASAKTYGGSGAEIALGIAVLQPNAILNPNGTNVGDVYIVGSTTGGNFASNDCTVLSVGVGAGANPRDPFIIRATGATLVSNWTSFLFGYNGCNGGGSFANPATADDALNAVAVDPFGRAIIAGQTQSNNLSTTNAYQVSISGGGTNFDCLLGRIQPFTAPNNYVTYYGATNSNENCLAVGTDTSGQIYSAGTTTMIANVANALQLADGTNSSLNNPAVAGSLGMGGFHNGPNVSHAIGEMDGFKVRFNPNAVGSNPAIPQLNIAEFFYGLGAGPEALTSLAVTQDRTIYAGGFTTNTFSATSTPTFKTTLSGTQDGVLAAETVNDVLITPDGLSNILNPNNGLSFGPYSDGGSVPGSQTFVVSFTGATLPFTLPADTSTANVTYSTNPANTAFLKTITNDITPGVVRVTVDPATIGALQEGTHSATFNVTAPGSDNGAAQIRVYFVKLPTWSENVGSLTFNYDIATDTFVGGQSKTDTITTFDFTSTSILHLTATYGGASGTGWLQVNKTTGSTSGYRTLGASAVNLTTPSGDNVNSTLHFRVCTNGNCAGANNGGFPNNDDNNSTVLTPGVYTAVVTKTVDRVTLNPTQTLNITLNVVNTAQTVQLTPNSTPTLYAGQQQTIFATVANPTLNVGIFIAPDTVGWGIGGLGGACTGGTTVTPNGTLSNAGPSSSTIFTAPNAIASATTVTVTACRPAPNQTPNPSTATLNINLLPPSAVTLAPAGPLTLYSGQTQQFVTSIANAPGVTATYAITSGAGSIGTTSGIYVAPNPINSASTATVQATIVAADGTKQSNTVTINLSPASTLSLAPTSASLYQGQTQQFTATATNAGGATPTFTLSGPGSVNASGLYTAPASVSAPANATVTATLVAPDGVRVATGNVTLNPPSSVAVACTPGVIYGGQTSSCTETTINPSGLTATWSVLSGGGSISPAGVYTAPANAGPNPITVTVQASAVAPDGTRTGTQTITVLPPSAISIVPNQISLYAGNQFLFTASVANANGVQPTYQVLSGPGSVSSTGLYSAPGSVPTATTAVVRATIATADGPRTADSTINLLANPVMTPATVNLYGNQSQQFTVAAPPAGWTLTFSATEGTINAQTGLYTAPSTVATQHAITVTATISNNNNQGLSSISTTSTVTLYPPTTVVIAPTSTSLKSNQTQQFTATTTNTVPGTPAVTFAVLNPSPLTGTVNASTGLYSAPGVVATPLAVTVRATLAGLDGTKTADAIVNLVQNPGVTVSPTSASLYASQTVGLTASTVGSAGGDVITWTVNGAGSLNTTTGTSVTYSAPATVLTSSSVTVTASAFNATDGTRTASAVLTLVPPVSVSIAPSTAGPLYPAGTALASAQVLTATVLNSTNPTVTWTLVSGPGSISNATGTQVTYNAPAAPGVAGTAVIMATATTPDPSGPKTATATVTVMPSVTISINPTSATMVGTKTQQFTSTIGNTNNTAATWTATGGTISPTGLFTAPNPGVTTQYTVTATSVFDATKSASAVVTVTPSVLGGSFDNNKYVTRLYIDFLGRNPDVAGSTFWVNRITSNTETAPQVGQDFFNSPEFHATGLVIVNAYIGLLGRDPDFAGFNFWLQQIRNGQTQTALFNTFVSSPEFQASYGTLSNDDFVKLLYLNTLKRAATASDVAFWSPQVGTLGKATIAGYFILSDEFNIRFRTQQLADLLYLGFLARTPDALGRTFWTNELNQGVSELTVINNFITSTEYLGRLGATQ